MKIRLALSLLGVSLLTGGCASQPTNPMDPLEPMNRVIFNINDKVDRAVAKPVAEAYQAITPPPVRTGISNFFDNILDAYSVINDVLSAQGMKAMNDLMRFAVNTTLGVFGLVDFATPMGLTSNKTTLGDTFAHWGWQNSNYLVMPLLGPSTIRDGIGSTVTLYVSPDRRIIYKHPDIANSAWGLSLVNKRADYLSVTDMVNEAALDPYSYTRDAFLQQRAAQVNRENRKNGASKPKAQEPDQDLNIDQLVAPDILPSASSAPMANVGASAAQ